MSPAAACLGNHFGRSRETAKVASGADLHGHLAFSGSSDTLVNKLGTCSPILRNVCDLFLPTWWPHNAMRQILLYPIHGDEKIEA